MHHSDVRIRHCAATRGMWNSSPSSWTFTWFCVTRKSQKKYCTIHGSLGHFARLLTLSNTTSEHNSPECRSCFRRWLCGSRARWRLRNWTFPIFESRWCFPWFSEALVRCCRGKNCYRRSLNWFASLGISSSSLFSSSRLLQVNQRIAKATVRLFSCLKLMLLPLCFYGSAVTYLHLHHLAVALSVHNSLLAIVSTVTVTPLDINAALLHMIPLECCRVLLWLCFQQMFLTCFAHCHFPHPLEWKFQLASVDVFLYRNLIVSVSLSVWRIHQDLFESSTAPRTAGACSKLFVHLWRWYLNESHRRKVLVQSFPVSCFFAKMSLTLLVVWTCPCLPNPRRLAYDLALELSDSTIGGKLIPNVSQECLKSKSMWRSMHLCVEITLTNAEFNDVCIFAFVRTVTSQTLHPSRRWLARRSVRSKVAVKLTLWCCLAHVVVRISLPTMAFRASIVPSDRHLPLNISKVSTNAGLDSYRLLSQVCTILWKKNLALRMIWIALLTPAKAVLLSAVVQFDRLCALLWALWLHSIVSFVPRSAK